MLENHELIFQSQRPGWELAMEAGRRWCTWAEFKSWNPTISGKSHLKGDSLLTAHVE